MTRPSADRPPNRMRRRLAAVALGLVGVVGLGLASASQLTVGGGSLGVGTAMVASCQGATPVTVSFTSEFSSGAYRATQVKLSNVAGTCNDLSFRLQLTGAGGVAVGSEITGTVSLTGGVLTVPIPSTAVTSISGVAAVIRS